MSMTFEQFCALPDAARDSLVQSLPAVFGGFAEQLEEKLAAEAAAKAEAEAAAKAAAEAAVKAAVAEAQQHLAGFVAALPAAGPFALVLLADLASKLTDDHRAFLCSSLVPARHCPSDEQSCPDSASSSSAPPARKPKMMLVTRLADEWKHLKAIQKGTAFAMADIKSVVKTICLRRAQSQATGKEVVATYNSGSKFSEEIFNAIVARVHVLETERKISFVTTEEPAKPKSKKPAKAV